MSADNTAEIRAAAARAEFAAKLAKRLLMFPLVPQPGDTLEQHAACLERAYGEEILQALNAEASNAR
jgi:hypothetical protein